MRRYAHVCPAAPRAVHVEPFHDRARIEELHFHGALEPIEGALRRDRSRPGDGLELDEDALGRRWAAGGGTRAGHRPCVVRA